MKVEDPDINISSAGDMILDVNAENIYINISSSGDARITGTADELDTYLSSAGDLYAYDLVVRKAKVDASSAGNARIHVTEEVYLTASTALRFTKNIYSLNIHLFFKRSQLKTARQSKINIC